LNTKGRLILSHYRNILAGDSSIIRQEGILQKVAILGSGSTLAQGFMIIYAILVARHLKPDGYGLFTATYTTLALSSVLYNWGLDTWLLRQASISNQPYKLLGDVYIIKSFLGLLCGVTLHLGLPFLGKNIFTLPLLTIAIFDVWFDSLFNSEIAMLNALRRNRLASFLLVVSRCARLIIALGLILIGIKSPVTFALGRFSGTFITLIISWFIAPPKIESNPLRRTIEVFITSIPYGVSDMLATIYLQADVSLLAILSGEKRDVGVYAPASSLVNALFIIPAAGFSVMVPYLTSQYQNKASLFKSMSKIMFIGFGILGTALWLGLSLSSNLLVKILLGSEFAITGRLIVILSPILLMKSLNFGCATFLVSTGLQSRRIIPQGLSALANIALNLVLIPLYGVWGVAWAYVASEAILLGGYLTLTIKWFKINP
jgi:O-antigen/teichoic acid export membrane protein